MSAEQQLARCREILHAHEDHRDTLIMARTRAREMLQFIEAELATVEAQIATATDTVLMWQRQVEEQGPRLDMQNRATRPGRLATSDQCMERVRSIVPWNDYWFCSLPPGHTGEHIAYQGHNPSNTLLGRSGVYDATATAA